MKKKNILFISANEASFVKIDKKILSSIYTLHCFEFGEQKGIKMPLKQLVLFFWLLRNVFRAEKIYIWFADYHGFLPALLGKILNKKIAVAVGGFDATAIAELNYGAHLNPFRSWISSQVMNWADVLFPSSQSVANHAYKYVGKHLESKMKICYLGRESSDFRPISEIKRENQVVCVSGGSSINRMKLKGVDRVIDLAKRLPNIPFKLVGISGTALEWAKKEIQGSSNIEILSWCNPSELEKLYNQSKIIVQFSRYEAFGMVLLEAMQCECIPVTIAGLGAAEAIGENAGFILANDDPETLFSGVSNALLSPPEIAKNARIHANNAFKVENRAGVILKNF